MSDVQACRCTYTFRRLPVAVDAIGVFQQGKREAAFATSKANAFSAGERSRHTSSKDYNAFVDIKTPWRFDTLSFNVSTSSLLYWHLPAILRNSGHCPSHTHYGRRMLPAHQYSKTWSLIILDCVFLLRGHACGVLPSTTRTCHPMLPDRVRTESRTNGSCASSDRPSPSPRETAFDRTCAERPCVIFKEVDSREEFIRCLLPDQHTPKPVMNICNKNNSVSTRP